MKEKHLTKVKFLIKTNYLNHYSLNLLIGSLFLTLPILFCHFTGLFYGKTVIFFGQPLSLGFWGGFSLFPQLTSSHALSKERVAVDILSMGFIGDVLPLRLF
jgi:hypothetical protein